VVPDLAKRFITFAVFIQRALFGQNQRKSVVDVLYTILLCHIIYPFQPEISRSDRPISVVAYFATGEIFGYLK